MTRAKSLPTARRLFIADPLARSIRSWRRGFINLGAVQFERGRYSESEHYYTEALAIDEAWYGNELPSVNLQQDRRDEAETLYRRVQDIYGKAYGEHHYLYAISLSNLASVSLKRKEYVRAERLSREAVEHFTEALSASHPYTGIAQIKLGRAMLRQKRYSEAESHSLAGYQILVKQTSPSVTWLQSARGEGSRTRPAIQVR